MADVMATDRVFVHALNTVKKIPKTGASRPPPNDRLRLYGLYKQAMEGDVDGVMERPNAASGMAPDDLQREKDKWDAWNLQKGLSRTESKRRYVEALIDTMHRYATTPDAKELVAELEFVWNQIKHNSPSSSMSSPRANRSGGASQQHYADPPSEAEGPMKVISPMSEYDEAELRSQRQLDLEDEMEEGQEGSQRGGRWQRRVERALTTMSAEVAALREQITTGREWRAKKERSFPAWAKWFAWLVVKHLFADFVILAIVLLWMRKRKDRRLEDLVRAALRLAREYVRKVLPSRGQPASLPGSGP
ncbi:Autophagy protein 37 [Fusarium solani]|uniref:Acyl CoA binding protein-domain-containing protein n=1 Tax=Fusarium solani TaxID=169388 RepID=A0A9P9L194_FUSSL|nr:acyl CoA binding protein-domain-containing protein [Fusarium solani]KAH7272134.1 acyl CoA binding protein-domain-containing protein [Fusarium solani]KAI8678175.1 ACB domain-containing protein [Fusarium keratoplasticum]